MSSGIRHVAIARHHQSGDIEREQAQQRERDPVIEVRAPDDSALAGDVELAEPRVDQSEQRRQQDVRCEHRLVDLVPE